MNRSDPPSLVLPEIIPINEALTRSSFASLGSLSPSSPTAEISSVNRLSVRRDGKRRLLVVRRHRLAYLAPPPGPDEASIRRSSRRLHQKVVNLAHFSSYYASLALHVSQLSIFIVWFLKNAPDPEKGSAAAQEFFTRMEGAFRAHPRWAGSSQEELESSGEGLEKYAMTKIFAHAFATSPEDLKRDDELHQKMGLIQQFIHPRNLDIQPYLFQNETSLLIAQKELQKINMYKAPRDKLVCIIDCCRHINNLLLNASISSNENRPGIDEFLSLLIYITIKANPPQLHSNLQYIQRYRHQSRLVSEAAYFFINMFSAESFIWSINAKSLSMEEAEFEKNMECARALISGLALESSTNRNVGHISKSETREPNQKSLRRIEEKETRMKAENECSYFGSLFRKFGKNMECARALVSNAGHSLASSTNKRAEIAPAETATKQAKSGCTEEGSKEFLETTPMNDLVKKNGGSNHLLEDDEMISSFGQFRFLYAQLGDLTLDDVEDLLCSYKQLVLRYMVLSKGLSISDLSIPPPTLQTHSQTTNPCRMQSRSVSD
ncbi:hypothetical protein ACLOJK_018139 [Asimina triloba]